MEQNEIINHLRLKVYMTNKEESGKQIPSYERKRKGSEKRLIMYSDCKIFMQKRCFKVEVLNTLREDSIGNAVRGDRGIVIIGYHLFEGRKARKSNWLKLGKVFFTS